MIDPRGIKKSIARKTRKRKTVLHFKSDTYPSKNSEPIQKREARFIRTFIYTLGSVSYK